MNFLYYIYKLKLYERVYDINTRNNLKTRKISMEKFGVVFILCFSSKILTRDISYLCKKKRIYVREDVAISTNKERLKINEMCMQLYIFLNIFRRKISEIS
jgi:hypothetical protein